MKKQFGDNYYNQKEFEEDFDPKKWTYEELGEYHDEYDGEGNEEGYEGHEGYEGQEGYEGEEGDGDGEGDGQEGLVGEEELYHLDYEDIVADIPCRFKYRQVEPVDYGLTVEDILLAKDSELNKYVGLKKISGYSSNKNKNNYKAANEEVVSDRKLARKRKQLRDGIKERLEAERQELEAQQKTSQQGKAKRYEAEKAEEVEVEVEEEKAKRRKRVKKNKNKLEGNDNGDLEEVSSSAKYAFPFVAPLSAKDAKAQTAKSTIKSNEIETGGLKKESHDVPSKSDKKKKEKKRKQQNTTEVVNTPIDDKKRRLDLYK